MVRTVVWGPGGAPGRTTVAVALAAELAYRGRSTLLVDADLQGGTVATQLCLEDRESGLAACCYQADGCSFDAQALAAVVQSYRLPPPPASRGKLSPGKLSPGKLSTGKAFFDVLTGITEASEASQLGEGPLLRALEVAESSYDRVVVDLGSALPVAPASYAGDPYAAGLCSGLISPADLNLRLLESSRVLAICLADPVGVTRFLRLWPTLSALTGAERTVVLANQVRSTAVGGPPQRQLRETLVQLGGVPAFNLLSYSRELLDRLLLAGLPLASAPAGEVAVNQLRVLTTRLEELPLSSP